MNFHAIISLGENQIRLHPGNASSGIDQEFCNAVRAQAAIFVEVFAAFVRDGLHAALNGNAVGAAQQIQSFFIPEIDAGLEANLHRTLGNSFQQAMNVLPNTENFIDEIDVLDPTRNQRIHFLEHCINAALAEFIAKKRLVAEGAGPGTSAGELKFGAKAAVIGENVMPVPVGFDVVIFEIKRARGEHVSDRRSWADVQLTVFFFKTASNDFVPWFAGKFRENLVGFAPQSNITTYFADSGGGRGRRMRADGDFDGFALQAGKPFHGDTQFWRRTTPEKIGRRGRNDEKIWRETFEAAARFVH